MYTDAAERFAFGDLTFSLSRLLADLTPCLYRHRDLIVQADVQQLKNSVDIDMHRAAVRKFKVGDPIVPRLVSHVALKSVPLNTVYKCIRIITHAPDRGLSSLSTTRTVRFRKCSVSYLGWLDSLCGAGDSYALALRHLDQRTSV
jgi:hypothetical protein